MARTYDVNGSLLYIGSGVDRNFPKFPSAQDFAGQSWTYIGGLTGLADLPVSQESTAQRLISERVTSYTKGAIEFGEFSLTFAPDLQDSGQQALVTAQRSCKYFPIRIEAGADCGDEHTVTISVATPGVVTWNNHGLADGTPVRFVTTGTLPGGIMAEEVYYVVNGTTNDFEVATYPGGSPVTTTGTQTGVHTAIAMPSGLALMFYAQPKYGGYSISDSYLREVPFQLCSYICEV